MEVVNKKMIAMYRAYNKHLKKMQQVLEIYLDPEIGGVSVWGKSSVDFLTGEHEAAQDFWTWQDIELMQAIPYPSKEAQDIYEGDIIATGKGKDYTKSIVRIGATYISIDTYESSYTKPYYGIWLEGSIDLEQYLFEGKMIVLGNICEHPDLFSEGVGR